MLCRKMTSFGNKNKIFKQYTQISLWLLKKIKSYKNIQQCDITLYQCISYIYLVGNFFSFFNNKCKFWRLRYITHCQDRHSWTWEYHFLFLFNGTSAVIGSGGSNPSVKSKQYVKYSSKNRKVPVRFKPESQIC